ncbi:putative HVA22-like protein g [Lactuca sativa]|uniref:HVA22-like protein n=1 Tax=Lactuca sativa TaxID=4236 RepID=A0A9R1URC8_LACSA|nr:putative HVA22-like protein g [Lactuca sativa]KAJ0191742.1 hypothetical protein LSAT_V11C800401280 [Lactuca sativa]
MIGSFLTRGLVMVFGYAYPAYECFKSVEKNKPDIDQLRFWCQYWILVAVLTVSERIGDTFISWVPMYSEAKLAFFIYLWYPKTKGTGYVYESFFRPYISKHEREIDRSLMELRTMAVDAAVLYWQKAGNYIQTKTFDILQYVASQSTPKPQPDNSTRQHDLNLKAQKVVAHEETKEPSSPVASSSSSSGSNTGTGTDTGETEKPDVGPTQDPPLPDSDVLTKEKESKKESVVEEAKESVRVTRARLRKATSLQ